MRWARTWLEAFPDDEEARALLVSLADAPLAVRTRAAVAGPRR